MGKNRQGEDQNQGDIEGYPGDVDQVGPVDKGQPVNDEQQGGKGQSADQA